VKRLEPDLTRNLQARIRQPAATEPAGGASSETATTRLSRRRMLQITAVTGAAIAFGGWLGSGLLRLTGLHRARATRIQLGTLVTITVVHPDAGHAQHTVAQAFAEIERLENLLSRHREHTPVGRLNRAGRIVDPPAELLEVMRAALQYSAITDGAFDVTMAPLLNLFATRFQSGLGAPTPEQLSSARKRVNWRHLHVNDDMIRLEQPDMSVTLDGIAKGYVVDRTARLLSAAGLDRVLIDAGGDVASTVAPTPLDNPVFKEPWRVGVQDPRNSGGVLGVLSLAGESAATSGDYLESFTADRRYHHIIDPRTGESPHHTSAVTVVAPTAMDADALSTAVFVLGPAAGRQLLEGMAGVEGLIVSNSGELLRTGGVGRYFT
jgi:thiamine biosynthesis lipoprotein